MVELGVFVDEKLELIKGFIVRMSPQNVRHASVVQSLTHLFATALVAPGRAAIRVQLPLAASDLSEPEPDIAVVAPGAYRDAHPTTAFLVVEVADSSLRLDRSDKAEVYAAANVEEYWIVDTRHDLVEVHTDIVDGAYSRVTPHGRGQSLSPRAFPDVTFHVGDILG
jgi:Uma2 family endonuclease